ncbi:MAG: hypothetical protein F6K21_06785 [Symploca sp. SIO2D2]|nr:hypothetical protein [Symploca sp. SIO2D2]
MLFRSRQLVNDSDRQTLKNAEILKELPDVEKQLENDHDKIIENTYPKAYKDYKDYKDALESKSRKDKTKKRPYGIRR